MSYFGYPARSKAKVGVWVDRSSIGLLLFRAGPGRTDPGSIAMRFRDDAER